LIRAPPPGETSGSPVVDPAGKLLGYRGADSDATERKTAEMVFMQQLAHAGKLAQGIFIARRKQ
jgi:hypothetical protein